MTIHRKTLAVLLLSALASACGGEAARELPTEEAASGGGSVGYSVGGDGDAASAPPAVPPVQPGSQPAVPTLPTQADTATPAPQMIIRNGEASVRVDDLKPAMESVRRLAARLGGYVANTTQETGADQEKHARMEMKIPSPRFDQAMAGLDPIGRLERQTTTSEDVGEEYVDVSARQANARRLEERLLALLESRTGRLEDVLAVERELARVRGEIERAEGRLRYLRTRAAMSTLTVHLYEGGFSGANPVTRAFGRAWENFVSFVAGFIEALGWLIPLLLVLAVLWRVVRWLFGRRGPGGRPWWDSRRRPPPPASDAPPPPSASV